MDIRKAAASVVSLWLAAMAMAQPPIVVMDAFGRDVTERGITLLDWEGFMANPAIRLTFAYAGPGWIALPASYSISSDCPRLMFERSGDDRRGIGARVEHTPASPASTWVSIFPDRDGKDEDHKLIVTLLSTEGLPPATVEVPVHVVDQDRSHSTGFPITLDFAQDRTGFFKRREAREIARQAADDWAFFLDGPAPGTVQAGDEETDVWNPDGFVSTRNVKNAKPYKGFLLYLVGIAGKELRSGGSPSHVGKPQAGGALRRSGSVDVEIRGNYHHLGWFFTRGENDWWCSGSLADEPADFYSIVLHEMGHALAFEGSYPAAGLAQSQGRWIDLTVSEYLGASPTYDRFHHFTGSVDPASRFGVFGAEYEARMKVRRWLLTKAHLLLLRSAGYKLRPVSCFEPLAVSYKPAKLRVGRTASIQPKASGGVPSYRWSVVKGEVPEGLALDEFTGAVTGTPKQTGPFEFTVAVTDQSPKAESLEVQVQGEVAK